MIIGTAGESPGGTPAIWPDPALVVGAQAGSRSCAPNRGNLAEASHGRVGNASTRPISS